MNARSIVIRTVYWIEYTTLGVDTSLVGNFFTGPDVQHTSLVGVDFYYLNSSQTAGFGAIDSLDLFNPHYGARPHDIAQFQDQDKDVEAVGIYFQEQVKFFDRLSLVAGGRGDFVWNNLDDNFAHSTTDRYDSAFTPRFGVVYEAVPKQVSLYASYSRSFLSQPGFVDRSGQLLAPEEGEQYEIGTKADLFNGRLSATLAAYQIERTNVSTADPFNLGTYLVTGAERHRGVDFNIAVNLTKGWDMIASYAYMTRA